MLLKLLRSLYVILVKDMGLVGILNSIQCWHQDKVIKGYVYGIFKKIGKKIIKAPL